MLFVMHATVHNKVINWTGVQEHFACDQTAHTMHANSGITYDLNFMLVHARCIVSVYGGL